MRAKKRIVATILTVCVMLTGCFINRITVKADMCGGLEEEDIYQPEENDVVKDPVLHWAIRSAMNAVKEKVVLTEEMVGNKMVSYISFEQTRHPEDFAGWTKQYWIENLEGIQYAKSAKMINICYIAGVEGKRIKNIQPLSNLTQLQTLLLKQDGLTDITPLKTLVNLQELDVSENLEIADISAIKEMKKLRTLNLCFNKIKNVDEIAGLTALEYVNLSNNKITTLPDLKNLTEVTFLDISNNELTDISAIVGMKHLKELNLSGNTGIKDIKPLANLIHLEKDKTYLPDNSVKDDLFSAIEVNKLFNEFNISKMTKENLDAVKKALDMYENLTAEQKDYIEQEKIDAARKNMQLVSEGKPPVYYPEYDEGGDRVPVFDRVEISVIDKKGKPLPNVEFSKKRETAYSSDESVVSTNSLGKLVLMHSSTDGWYDQIIVRPKGEKYVAQPEKISYAVLNKSTDLINGKKATGLEELQFVLIPKEEYVDKTELGQAIKDTESVEEGYKYTEESYVIYEKALDKAKDIYHNIDATRNQVEKAVTDLKEAIKNLKKQKMLTTLKIKVKDSRGNLFTRPFKLQVREVKTGAGAWNEWTDKYTSVVYINASPAWHEGQEWEVLVCNHERYDMQSIVVKIGVDKDGQRYFKEVDGKTVDVDFEKEVMVKQLPQAPDPSQEIKPDSTVLEEYLAKAEKYAEEDYTPNTYRVLQEAIQNAKTILDKKNVVQEDYNEAVAKIRRAEQGLEIVFDKTELQEEINLQFQFKEEEYTKESWTEYQKALENAKKVNQNINATKKEIEEALKNTQEARENLKKKVDKATLQEKLKEAKSLKKEDYESGFEELQKVISEAEKILNDSKVTQEQVNIQIKNLEIAIGNLQEKPTPEVPGEIICDEHTFRAKVVDEKGKALSNMRFLLDGGFADCRYEIATNEKGILEYKVQSYDFDLGFSVKSLEETYISKPEKMTFETNASAKIVSVNGEKLSNKEMIFTLISKEKPQEVNKEELKKAVALARTLEEDKYTEESYQRILKALKEAETLLENEKATQEEVDKITKELNLAIEQKVEKPELEDKVICDEHTFRVKVVDESGKVLENMKFLLDGGFADCRYELLTNEKGILEYKVQSYDYDLTFTVKPLEEKYNSQPEKMTFETNASAKIVSVNGEKLSDKEMFFTLVSKEKPQEVNKKELQKAIQLAKSLEEEKYTEESYQRILKALNVAEALLENEKATQEEVDKATVELNRAISEKVEVEKPKPELPKPEEPKPELPKPEEPKPELPKPEEPKLEKPLTSQSGNPNQQKPNEVPVKTGDDSKSLPFMTTMVISMGAIYFILKRRMK